MRRPRGSARSRDRERARSVRARAGHRSMTEWSLHLLRAGQKLFWLLESGQAKLLLLVSRGVDEDDGGNADDRVTLRQFLHDRIVGFYQIGFDPREAIDIVRD